MAVTVVLKKGNELRVNDAVSVDVGYFLERPGKGGRDRDHGIELKDAEGKIVGRFLFEEVIGYFVEKPATPYVA
jgi:hypothetical protein